MADEPFIMLSLKDDKAKKLANVLTNKSSSKILSFLANHEGATESEIAKKLKLPISTVNYNMKALVDAKLVVDDEYHYSSRGKEVNHYRLARKYIIIAPEDEEEGFWERVKKYVPVALLAAATGVVVRLMSAFTGTLGAKSLSADSMGAARTMPLADSGAGAMRAMDAAPEMLKTVAEDKAVATITNAATNQTINATTQTTIPPPTPALYRPPVEAANEPSLLHTIMGDWLGWFLIGVFVFVLMAMLVEALRMKKMKKNKTKKSRKK